MDFPLMASPQPLQFPFAVAGRRGLSVGGVLLAGERGRGVSCGGTLGDGDRDLFSGVMRDGEGDRFISLGEDENRPS